MAGFFDQIVAVMTAEETVEALVAGLGPLDREGVRVGTVLAAAAVVSELALVTAPAGTAAWLRSVDMGDDGSAGPDRPDGADQVRQAGEHQLGEALFGWRSGHVASMVAGEARVGETAAERLLEVTSWIAVTHLAERVRGAAGAGTGVDLRSEADELALQGWDRWIDRVRRDPAAGHIGDEGTIDLEPEPEPGTEPEPDPEPESATGLVGPGPLARRPGGGGGLAGPRPAARPGRRSARWVLAGTLLLVALGAAAVLVEDLVSDREVETLPGTAPGVTAAAAPLDLGEERSPVAAESTGSTAASTATTAVGSGSLGAPADGSDPETGAGFGTVSYQLALADPRGRTDAAGTVVLDLDTDSGQLCYRFEVSGLTSPFPGHIHVGPSGGGGGIIADFGYMTGSPSGCVQSHPADLTSVARNPSGHYVELHDTTTGFSIRSQLGEGPEVGSGSGPSPADGEVEGAVTVVSDGRLYLRGEVPDQRIRDDLVAAAVESPVGSIEVVDELTVVPGAATPSGRIIVEDPILFEFDSTELSGDSADVVAGLARILRAKPGWTTTLVGNTDGVGDIVYNLVLSLQRAIAIREALVADGVSPDAVTIRGDGPFAPVGDNDTPDGRSLNRRIDLVVEADGL